MNIYDSFQQQEISSSQDFANTTNKIRASDSDIVRSNLNSLMPQMSYISSRKAKNFQRVLKNSLLTPEQESLKLSVTQIQNLISQKLKPFQAISAPISPGRTASEHFSTSLSRPITVKNETERLATESDQLPTSSTHVTHPHTPDSPYLQSRKSKSNALKSSLQLKQLEQQQQSSTRVSPHPMNKADQLRLQQAIIKTTTTPQAHHQPMSEHRKHLSPQQQLLKDQNFLVTTGSIMYQNPVQGTTALLKQQLQQTARGGSSSLIVCNSQHLGHTQKQPSSSKLQPPSPSAPIAPPFKRRTKRISQNGGNNSQIKYNQDQFMNNAAIIQQNQFAQARTSQQDTPGREKQQPKLQLLEVFNPQYQPYKQQQNGPPPRTAGGVATGLQVVNYAAQQQYLQLPAQARSPMTNTSIHHHRLSTAAPQPHPPATCTSTLVATPTGFTTTSAVMTHQKLQQQQVQQQAQFFVPQTKTGQQKSKSQNVRVGVLGKKGQKAMSPQFREGGEQSGISYAGQPLLTQTPATAVLVPTASLAGSGLPSHHLPQNGYLLGYINTTVASNGQQIQQVVVPTMAQQDPRQMDVIRLKQKNGRNVSTHDQRYATQDNFYPHQGAPLQIRSQDTRVTGDHNLLQCFLEENSQIKSTSRHQIQENQLSVDDIYSADGIKVRGTGVSLQNDRSPTEMLRRVVRAKQQQEQTQTEKKSPNRQQVKHSHVDSKHSTGVKQPPHVKPMVGHQLQVLQNQLMMPSHMQPVGVLQQNHVAEDHQILVQQPSSIISGGSPAYAHLAVPVPQQSPAYYQQQSPKTVLFLAVLPQNQSIHEPEQEIQSIKNPLRSKRSSITTKKPRQRKASNQETHMSPSSCLVGQACGPTTSSRQIQTQGQSITVQQAMKQQEKRPPSRSNSSSVQPRIRVKAVAEKQLPLPQTNLSVHTATMYANSTVDIQSPTFEQQVGQGNQPAPSVIMQIFVPPSALRLAKEIQRVTDMIGKSKPPVLANIKVQERQNTQEEGEGKSGSEPALVKKRVIDVTLNLRDHPINVVLRKANEFSQETFLKPNDKEIDLKKVQQLCNFFKIAMPHRVANDVKRLKSREFQICAKERILICLYENINKENGMVRPDMPTRVPAQQRPTDTFGTFGEAGPNSSFFGQTYGRGEIVRGTEKDPKEKEGGKEENGTQPQFLVNPYQPNQRKFYIARGNNHGIVRIVFKQRWWWQMTNRTLSSEVRPASFESNHFMWTQWRKDHLLEQLPTFKKKCELAKTQFKQQITQNSVQSSPAKTETTKDAQTPSPSPVQNPDRMCLYAKMEANYHLSNKKALFWNMMNYYKKQGRDPFESLPLTFHVENGLSDQEFRNFSGYYNRLEGRIRAKKEELNVVIKEARKQAKKSEKLMQQTTISSSKGTEMGSKQSQLKGPLINDQAYMLDPYDPEQLSYFEDEQLQAHYNIKIARNIWIIKPGENSNRGCGIYVCNSLQEITQEVKNSNRSGGTLIIQKYIDRPLLFANRKFDIRIFAVLSSINSCLKGFVYGDGYLRTSCKEFSLDNLSARFVHLTNDAIQQTSEEYGRFESGNKISFQQFQRYLDHAYPDKKINFNKDLLPQIKKLITDSFYATFTKIDPNRRQHSFEIFGYDFMIDSNFKVYIIECNTNPCLELSCPLMARIIPAMLDNVFRVVVDPLFPPPDFSVAKKNLMHDILPINKLELVFDERLSGEHIRSLATEEPKLNLRIVDDEGCDDPDDIEEESENEEDFNDLQAAAAACGDFLESASGGSARST